MFHYVLEKRLVKYRDVRKEGSSCEIMICNEREWGKVVKSF